MYLEAATGADGWRQIDLQRRAAEQFLVGGHIDEGLDVIRTVLRALHMRLAPSPLVALASLVWRRARIRWRGLAFVARDPDHIPADRLLRIDTCWSVATGLAMVDNIRAADFNTRHLLLALEAGEPYRIARALALEAGFLACGGSLQYCRRVRGASRRPGERIGSPARRGAVGAQRRHVGAPVRRMEEGVAAVRARAGRPARTVHRVPPGR